MMDVEAKARVVESVLDYPVHLMTATEDVPGCTTTWGRLCNAGVGRTTDNPQDVTCSRCMEEMLSIWMKQNTKPNR